ncbi:hypothetical protein [Sphingomonas mesophila]|uniref:hypothetical protein n=1 Tax=Sphingomonas mesophila TaxID=2303576 RepID=UPI000E58DC67|nr:hypothetical protein [Sphingomonas mesophila]
MSAFEFFFSFYGLLLGLCVAQIAGGIGHAIVVRRESRFGWLTPTLAAFLLLDLASFWFNAWDHRSAIGVTAATIYAGMIVALSYYIAVVLLFPVHSGNWEDLDEHYWSNKRWVVLGVALANFATLAWFIGLTFWLWPAVAWVQLGVYFGPLAILFFSRRAWLDGLCYAILIVVYVASTVMQR